MGPSIIINYPPPPPPPLWSNYEFHPLIKDRSANLFLFYEKEKQTKFHQKILGTDVATPPEMTFEAPLSPGFHCPSVWLQLGEGGSTVQREVRDIHSLNFSLPLNQQPVMLSTDVTT